MDTIRDFLGGLGLYALAFGLLYAGFSLLGVTGFAVVLFAAFFTYPMVWVLLVVLAGCGGFIAALFSDAKPRGR